MEFADWSGTQLTYQVFLSRIICGAFLHMQLESEVRQALLMLNYTRLKIYHREYRTPMIFISMMQLLGAIGTEIISIILICN